MSGLCFALIFLCQIHMIRSKVTFNLPLQFYSVLRLLWSCIKQNYTSKSMKFLVASLYLQAALKSASWPEAHDSYYMPSHINGESQFDFASASAAYPFTVACVREGLLASHPC